MTYQRLYWGTKDQPWKRIAKQRDSDLGEGVKYSMEREAMGAVAPIQQASYLEMLLTSDTDIIIFAGCKTAISVAAV